MTLKILFKSNLLLIILFSLSSCYWNEFKLAGKLERDYIIAFFKGFKEKLSALQGEIIKNVDSKDEERLKGESKTIDDNYKKGTHTGYNSKENKESYLKKFRSKVEKYNQVYLTLDKLLKNNEKLEDFTKEEILKDFTISVNTLNNLSKDYVLTARHGTFEDLKNLKLNDELSFKFLEFYEQLFEILTRLLKRFCYIDLEKLLYMIPSADAVQKLIESDSKLY